MSSLAAKPGASGIFAEAGVIGFTGAAGGRDCDWSRCCRDCAGDEEERGEEGVLACPASADRIQSGIEFCSTRLPAEMPPGANGSVEDEPSPGLPPCIHEGNDFSSINDRA